MASVGQCFLDLRPNNECKLLDFGFGFSEWYSGAPSLCAFAIDHHDLEELSKAAAIMLAARTGKAEG